MLERAVFCDFDGTITERETFVAVLKQFTPKLAEEFIPKLHAREMLLSEGVRRMVESIPSRMLPEMIAFNRDSKLREGFESLLRFLHERHIPFVVISGGLMPLMEPLLASYLPLIHAVHAAHVDANGEYLRVISPDEGDGELVSKARVMARYPAREQIGIGDSVTDVGMAMKAQKMFARDKLADFLTAQKIPFEPWADFHTIRAAMELS